MNTSDPTQTSSAIKRVRVMAILQLIIAFTVVMSSGGYPFMGELFAFKSKGLLFHTVIGDATLLSTPSTPALEQYRQLLERNRSRFSLLPENQKESIMEQYRSLQEQSEKSFSAKFMRGIRILAFELPAFERAWLFLSIVVCVLLLMRVEGAAVAAWLLPVLTLCYAVDNQWNGSRHAISSDIYLFPSEEVIVREYLKEPLSNNILEQKPQLLLGWKRYLIQEWAQQLPSSSPEAFETQAEDGEFAFNVARIKALSKDTKPTLPFQQRQSMFMILLYLIWNILFAWQANGASQGLIKRKGAKPQFLSPLCKNHTDSAC